MSDTNAGRDRLRGKVAVITGAARGIGRAAAVAFAKEGANVAGLDICAPVYPTSGVQPATKSDLEETGNLVKAAGVRWLGLTVDQREMEAVREAASQTEREFGAVDIVFANAGIQGFKSLLEMGDEDWRIQIENNLTGTANVIRAFAPRMADRKRGRIIVTGSMQGRHGMKNGSAYAASKWGILGLMKSAALELAPYGVTVNAMIPGLIDTALTRHEERYAQTIDDAGQKPAGKLDQDEPKARQIMKTKTPLGVAFIEPEDLAPVVIFLASDDARMVTGAVYEVNGGESAHNTA